MGNHKACAAPKWCHIGATMNITVKDVPQELHKRLREAAVQSGRSLNKLILCTLERSFFPRRVDRGELIAKIRKRRESMDVWIQDGALSRAIKEGRR